MNLPCCVIRDLLPLYAEDMAEAGTKTLVEAHLSDCPECREKLSGMKIGEKTPVDTAKPLLALKKQLAKKRLFAALYVGLIVFAVVFTVFFRANDFEPIPWRDGIVTVKGVEEVSDDFGLPESDGKALVFKMDASISGTETETIVDEDGTRTIILQGFGRKRLPSRDLCGMTGGLAFSPVPDRVIYGFNSPQALLWGEDWDGGVAVLPRLSLIYYFMIALIAAALTGILWFFFRGRKFGKICGLVFFAPLSYVLSQLLLKGTDMTSFSLPNDLVAVSVLALSLYALFLLSVRTYRGRGHEFSEP